MNFKKIIAFASILGFLSGFYAVFAQDGGQENPPEDKTAIINGALNSVMGQMNDLVSENNTCLNVYGDAYIGKLWPSEPRHWGAGLTFCGSFFNTSDVKNLASTFIKGLTEEGQTKVKFNMDSIPQIVPLPTAALATRLGGFGIPFDIGLFGIGTFNLINNCAYANTNYGIDLISLGMDVRFCVLDKEVPPKVSVGAGYSFSRSSFKGRMESHTTGKCAVPDPASPPESGNTITVPGSTFSYCETAMENYTNSWFLQVHVSKKFNWAVPFGGYRLVTNYYEGKFNWGYEVEFTPDDENLDPYTQISNSSGGDVQLNKNAFSLYNQLFLGCGFEFKYFSMSISAQWNINTNYVSAAFNIGYRI